jgi:hypothetical protein
MAAQIPPHPAAATVIDFPDWATNSTKCFNISLGNLVTVYKLSSLTDV